MLFPESQHPVNSTEPVELIISHHHHRKKRRKKNQAPSRDISNLTLSNNTLQVLSEFKHSSNHTSNEMLMTNSKEAFLFFHQQLMDAKSEKNLKEPSVSEIVQQLFSSKMPKLPPSEQL